MGFEVSQAQIQIPWINHFISLNLNFLSVPKMGIMGRHHFGAQAIWSPGDLINL